MIQIERLNEDTGDIRNVCLYQVADLSRILHLKIDKRYVGRNICFKILKWNKILTKDNQPNQSFINLGLAEFYGIRKHGHLYYSPVFTEKGINYLLNGFSSGKYQVKYEKVEKLPKLTLDQVC